MKKEDYIRGRPQHVPENKRKSQTIWKVDAGKVYYRTVKDSGKTNEAFDVANQIQLLSESKLQSFFKMYPPNANLQLSQSNDNEHVVIINSEDKEEEALPIPNHINKDISEQIDLQLQQQDLEEKVLARVTTEKMKEN